MNVNVTTTDDDSDSLSFEVDSAIAHARVGQGTGWLDKQLHGLGEELHSFDEFTVGCSNN